MISRPREAARAGRTSNYLRILPGFISAYIHRGLEWASRAHFEAMLRDPKAQTHMWAAAALVEKFEPHLYEVVP
ncbi:hypothetical protein [Archangium lipolyticum]|uniref:hypothetical protein n=1 Tax=Archangium lipolyticum TaxID=2970465 RepID=UPI00214A3F9F|nr:hypothetical protein [Archangium lipolyticum]